MDNLFEFNNTVNYPPVRLSTIIIYLIYFGMMWPIIAKMLKRVKTFHLAEDSNEFKLLLANFLLVAGDTAMFLCWLMLFINYDWVNGIQFNKGMLSIVPLGIATTSITMSLYYLYLYFFYKDKFKGGKWNFTGYLILGLVIIRFILHFNPYNLWLNMDRNSEISPNYSAWLRNAPLFIYGLLIVSLIYSESKKAVHQNSDPQKIKSFKNLKAAMICLYFSFLFYGLDVFFSHLIPNSLIWMTYTFKTFAYVGAAWYMLKAEFKPA